MHHPVRWTIALVGAGALMVPLTGVAVSQASTGGRYLLPGTHPGWATPSRAVGTPSSTLSVSFRINLNYRHAGVAEQRAMAVATPSSPLFHHYLSSREFNSRFAPTGKAVATVETFLRDHGFSVVGVPANHRWVSARGTVSQVNSAFGTTMRTYSYSGHSLLSPQRAISLPDSLRSLVLTVTGLDQSSLLQRPNNVSRPMPQTQPNTQPPPASKCSHYWDQHEQILPPAYAGRDSYPTYICGYHPDQFLSAYGLKQTVGRGQDGTGTKVAILDAYASPTIEQDANAYPGVPSFAKGQFAEKDFTPFTKQDKCGDWSTEESIDVESVHGMASGADVLYVGAKNCGPGLTNALNWVVNNFDNSNSPAYGVSIVSNSYGYAGEDVSANLIKQAHAIAVQAANEGIGLYFSSGDGGDSSEYTGGIPEPDYEASDPLVTGVGGTSLAVNADGGYQFETGWGSTIDRVKIKKSGKEKGYQLPLPGEFYAGAGGGTSTLFNEPGYQRGVVPPSLARAYDGTPNRVVPDVAMNADPFTGMMILQTVDGQLTKSTWGGTSLACPLFAGTQAIIQGNSATTIGFANPTLYSLNSSVYRDVVGPRTPEGISNPSGTYLVTLDRDTSLQTTYGYDNVTGRGTPDGAKFVKAEKAALQ